MAMKALLACATLALLTALAAAQQYDPVVIGVHYRSTADEAIKFVTRQLYPAFLTLNTQNMHIGLRPKRVRLEMIPYEDVTNDVFTKNITGSAPRSHALLASKIHSCAVANLRDDWKQLSYLSCIMLEGYEKSAECAETTCFDDSLMVSGTVVGMCAAHRKRARMASKIRACVVANRRDDWERLEYLGCNMLVGINGSSPSSSSSSSSERPESPCFDDSQMVSCVNTVDGDLLLMANINKTRQLGVTLTSAPVVTFNGEYKVEEQYMARLNLLALACDKFDGYFESYCEVPRARQTMTHNNFGTGYYYPEKRRCSFP